MRRVLRHLFAPSAKRAFPPAVLARIQAAIAASEASHRGEICFAVEAAMPLAALFAGSDARACAEAAFARLRVWDTEENNGVLVYLLLAEKRIEILADRGLAQRVDAGHWQAVCEHMAAHLAAGRHEAAVMQAVDEIGSVLREHFPQDGAQDPNQLADAPVVL